MLPGKAFGVTVGLGDDGDKDEALQFAFEAFVYVVGLEQAVMGVFIEIDGDIFFEGGFEFLSQISHKFCYPAVVLVVFLTVGNENVVFVIWD